jgi:hypothetical protein
MLAYGSAVTRGIMQRRQSLFRKQAVALVTTQVGVDLILGRDSTQTASATIKSSTLYRGFKPDDQ